MSGKITAPLPDFGTDRMWDFEQAGTASLWKSGPLFSTGARNTKPVNDGLRLNQCSPARNSGLLREQGSRRR
jgi:hypothetical protein